MKKYGKYSFVHVHDWHESPWHQGGLPACHHVHLCYNGLASSRCQANPIVTTESPQNPWVFAHQITNTIVFFTNGAGVETSQWGSLNQWGRISSLVGLTKWPGEGRGGASELLDISCMRFLGRKRPSSFINRTLLYLQCRSKIPIHIYTVYTHNICMRACQNVCTSKTLMPKETSPQKSSVSRCPSHHPWATGHNQSTAWWFHLPWKKENKLLILATMMNHHWPQLTCY